MTEKGVWWVGLAALALLSFFCIRHHLGDPELAPASAAATAPAVVAAPAPVAPALPAPSLAARFDGRAVVLEGTVGDEAARKAIVDRAASLYGAGNVTDRLQVASLSAPAWASGLVAGFPPDLRGVKGPGSAAAADGAIVLEGEMTSGEARDRLVAAVTAAHPGARIDNRLTVAAAVATAQSLADLLKTRPVEFATGSAQLTARGQATLDAVVPAFQRDTTSRFEIAGHTDNVGAPASNQALSEARARTVAAYLALKGVATDRFTTKGYGDTQPIGDNATDEGRQRNRRIEFLPL
jgi:OmpA-OmpF porin, OOP family